MLEAAQGTLETPKDAGKGSPGKVALWMQALDLQTKEERKWRDSAGKTIDIYRDKQGSQTDQDEIGGRRNRRYNILYSNTETMAPALYNSTPIPDIRRRFSDPDPAAKVASQILERGISFSVDQYDFDSVMNNGVKDLLLPGRTVTRVRYKPTMGQKRERVAVVKNEAGYVRASDLGVAEDETNVKTDDQGMYVEGDPYDVVTYEEVCCEHVQWGDFRRGPGKTWDEVPWVAFRHFLSRGELIKLNPTVGRTVPLDISLMDTNKDRGDQKPEPDIFKRLEVWEIWDKSSKKVLFIAPSYSDGPLKEEDDPLELDQFFPIPRPMYAVPVPETLVPTELYRLYKDQADELNTISIRLTRLTRAVKLQGIYAAMEGDNSFERLQNVDDGGYVPSQTAYNLGQNGNNIANTVWEKPIDKAAAAIDKLSMRQEMVKNNIYDIMGISDIIRGSSKASETATAQNIKAQWGSLRLQKLQAEVQRYARDLYRLMAEIIANKFSPQTLQAMTGIQLYPEAVKMQAQAAIQQAQAMGQEPPADLLKILDQPSEEEVMAVLRSDATRAFRIDIETDSTIQSDVQKSQQNMTQFIEGVGGFLNNVMPAIEGGLVSKEFAIAFVQAGARTFRLPRQVQDSIEDFGKQPPQQNASQQAEAMKAQAETQRTQADIQKTQLDGQIAQQKAQMDAARMQQEAQIAAQKGQFELLKMQKEMERDDLDHKFKMEEMTTAHTFKMAQLNAPKKDTVQ